MEQSSDEPEKILRVDVWLHAYQPKDMSGEARLAAILSRLGYGSEENNVAIPTNQHIKSTGDMSISKKRKNVENAAISSKPVRSSKGKKMKKEVEKNAQLEKKLNQMMKKISRFMSDLQAHIPGLAMPESSNADEDGDGDEDEPVDLEDV